MSRTILEATTADLIYSLGVHAARVEAAKRKTGAR